MAYGLGDATMRTFTTLFLLLASLSAAADVMITASNSGKGLGALAEGETVTYIKGHKMRSDSQHKKDSFSTLFDLDEGRMVILDHRKKTAEIMTMAEMREALASIDDEGVSVEFASVGESREIAGLACERFRADIRIPNAGPDGGPQVDMTMHGDLWIAADAPGDEDFRTFYLAAAERGMFTNRPEVVKAQPGQAKGWALWYRELATAGVPCETETSFSYDGAGPIAKMLNAVGKVTIKSTAQQVSEEPVPDSTFEVPADYKVKDRR
jgi:hypothetical protein